MPPRSALPSAKCALICVIGLSCMFLGGCFTTQDEPFSLVSSDVPHLKPGLLNCGDGAKTEVQRFIQLSYGKVSQYIFFGDSEYSTEPLTFYQVKGDRYIVSVASNGAAGETLYVAQITDASIEILNDAVESEQGDVEKMAKKYGVHVKLDGKSWSMSGPKDAQRKFMIDVADALPATDVVCKCSPSDENASAQ